MEGKGVVHERVRRLSLVETSEVLSAINTSETGLDHIAVERSRAELGSNKIEGRHSDSVLHRLRRAFINPFSVVLLILAVISLVTELIQVDGIRHNMTTVAIILVMLLVSGTVRFAEEMKAKKITDKLSGLIDATVSVRREGRWIQLPAEDLAVGDIVKLKAGDRVPADIRLTAAEDCYVSQAIITGESGIQQKFSTPVSETATAIRDYTNTLFMGTAITGGFCRGVVAAVGSDTAYGVFSNGIPSRKAGFDRGANSIAWVLIKFMLLLVPVVFVASGLTKGDWLSAFVFALSVAVGLTPELLPMVITACMAKGSSSMSKKQTVVKNINAMQGFGNMDVLCVDKTGTLTGDSILLEYYMDVLGNESELVLDCAYINSVFHTSISNYLDAAILKVDTMPGHEEHYRDLIEQFTKLDELPFDYQRKSAGVLIEKDRCRYIIVKGDVDSVVNRCAYVFYRNQYVKIEPDMLDSVHAVIDEMLEDGMKVVAVAAKRTESDVLHLNDESELTLLGYLAFFDAPKKSAASAIWKLKDLNIAVKVLTGDHASVACSICRRLEINTDRIMTGPELEQLSDDDAQMSIERTSVFAELTPKQKYQIVEILQSNGHSVGFLGDGMNDLPAEVQADVGISVDTACESVKEAADVILLKKDLNVLEEGVLEGRTAFANMTKYIKITASSNFGNICAVVIASICLPFFPMTSLQLLLLNLLYDLLCLALPWDHVDSDLCQSPLEWSGRTLPRFMLFFGTISTVFDVLTFAFLYFVLCPSICGAPFALLGAAGRAYFITVFQTGWFLESMWTQVLILHLLRTKHAPFIHSRPSAPVTLVTLAGIVLFTIMSMTGLGTFIGMTGMPTPYYVFLAGIVALYLLTISIGKSLYLKRYHSLL